MLLFVTIYNWSHIIAITTAWPGGIFADILAHHGAGSTTNSGTNYRTALATHRLSDCCAGRAADRAANYRTTLPGSLGGDCGTGAATDGTAENRPGLAAHGLPDRRSGGGTGTAANRRPHFIGAHRDGRDENCQCTGYHSGKAPQLNHGCPLIDQNYPTTPTTSRITPRFN